MKAIQHLYYEFKQYFDLSIIEIDNEYLYTKAICINDRYIISTYDFEFINATSYIECKNMFINNVIYKYLLNKNQLTNNELMFIDIYYKCVHPNILRELCQRFPNDKCYSYLLLQQL